MNLMRFLRRPISLRQRLILTIGAILLVFELISVFWLWHESTEQIQLFEQALRDNRNNDRHIMREIREAVASLIVPGVFMVSLTLFICYQAVRRITRPLAELQKELEARTADNLTPIAIHSATLEIEAVVSALNDLVSRLTNTLDNERLFTADVAHELRTPLAGVRLHLELLAKTHHIEQESRRRGNTDLPELSVAQIEQQLNLAVDRVMTEGGIADRELAALALKQASGDNVEAIFLLRAYRTTLAKLAVSEPLDTTGMRLERRISAVYKDIPGGQLLGPTYDYTHRLLDFTLLANGEAPTLTTADSEQQPSPHVFSLLARQGLAKFEEDSGAQPDDITRTPPVYPCSRSSRLQQLMRGDEGYLLALAYSTQRGYGRNHPFAGEIRSGYIDVSIVPEELGFAVNVGELLMTECEMVNGFIDPPDEPPHFTRGYGLVFGMSERKAMAMALVDRALQAPEYGEHTTGPAQDEEFVLAHADNVEAAGFVSHLKLPHYVDFQAELELLKRLQQEQNHG